MVAMNLTLEGHRVSSRRVTDVTGLIDSLAPLGDPSFMHRLAAHQIMPMLGTCVAVTTCLNVVPLPRL